MQSADIVYNAHYLPTCFSHLHTGLLTVDHVTSVDMVTATAGGRHVSVVATINSTSKFRVLYRQTQVCTNYYDSNINHRYCRHHSRGHF